jgi:hypothetical protein
MLLIRPAAAHRVTVFGSTRNSAATSPGVSRRSPVSTTPSLRRTKVTIPSQLGVAPYPGTYAHYSTVIAPCPTNGDSPYLGGVLGNNVPASSYKIVTSGNAEQRQNREKGTRGSHR